MALCNVFLIEGKSISSPNLLKLYTCHLKLINSSSDSDCIHRLPCVKSEFHVCGIKSHIVDLLDMQTAVPSLHILIVPFDV